MNEKNVDYYFKCGLCGGDWLHESTLTSTCGGTQAINNRQPRKGCAWKGSGDQPVTIQTPLPVPNPDIEIREGPGLPQKCFRPLGPQFGVKIRGGGRPHRPLSPGSATDYKHFKILKKCQSKLDCLIFEMLWLDPREAILFHCKYLLLSYRFYRLSVSFIIRVLFPCKYFRVFSQYLIIPFTDIYKCMLIFYFSTWKWPSNGRNIVNFYSPKTCYFFPK